MNAACLVCGERATTALGIRLRRRNTNAVWAPNLSAYLCDLHAVSGCEVGVMYRATSTGRVVVHVVNGDGATVSRVDHPIGVHAADSYEQGTLI